MNQNYLECLAIITKTIAQKMKSNYSTYLCARVLSNSMKLVPYEVPFAILFFHFPYNSHSLSGMSKLLSKIVMFNNFFFKLYYGDIIIDVMVA